MPFIESSVVTQTKIDDIVIPIVFAKNALGFSIFKRYVAMLPAYTPVPGNGIITKAIRPQNHISLFYLQNLLWPCEPHR